MFNPVGRAKYDAVEKCHEECGGNAHVAMRKYVELVRSVAEEDDNGGGGDQNGSAEARVCRDVWMEMEREIHEIEQRGGYDVVVSDANECAGGRGQDDHPPGVAEISATTVVGSGSNDGGSETRMRHSRIRSRFDQFLVRR